MPVTLPGDPVAGALVVATWNVLAEAYVVPGRYDGCDPSVLEPSDRRSKVVGAVAALMSAAPVVCLQEADVELVAALRAALSGAAVLWCPKGKGRPDGCVTVIADRSALVGSHRVAFADGSGHVAQLCSVTAADRVLTVANTHLRWAPPLSALSTHVGLGQARELVASAPPGPTVICGDLNDRPSGPVRSLLGASGFAEAHPKTLSAVVDGERMALDVIAGRGCQLVPLPGPVELPSGPLPDLSCPSDHVPLLAAVTW